MKSAQQTAVESYEIYYYCTTEVNMNIVAIEILQGSVVTQTVLGVNYTYPVYQLQISYSVCQKLRKLVESRQSYSNENGCIFWLPVVLVRLTRGRPTLLWIRSFAIFP